MSKKTVLDVRNISISFSQYVSVWKKRSLNVIRDLSVAVGEGEMVAVVGASGSGKSLLAHAILGILPYNAILSGEMLYFGETLTQKRIEELRGSEIALAPQSVAFLDPLMKVGPQVRKGQNDTERKVKSAAALSRYGLGSETEELYPFELSGGMARRVLIAATVMESPRLVIADEPTPGLHLDVAKRVMSHFREIADGGAGGLVITPQVIADARKEGSLDWMRTLPVPRWSFFAADIAIHTPGRYGALCPQTAFMPLTVCSRSPQISRKAAHSAEAAKRRMNYVKAPCGTPRSTGALCAVKRRYREA